MWNDDGGMPGHYHPPLSVERFRQIHLGYHAGSPVDCYLYPLCYCGYTTNYPTEAKGYAFILDRREQVESMGGYKELHQYCFIENLRRLFEQGHDPTALLLQEARRLDIDFWLHLRMNDWHHTGGVEEHPDRPGLPAGVNLFSSPWYEARPEYLLGADGIAGGPPERAPWPIVRWLQDFAHEEVRETRLEAMIEACERYDVDGFHFDFMRIPIYFKVGQEEGNAPLMTDLIRRARAELDRIGKKRGRHVGFAVRVPSTIAGSQAIGLDAPTWVREGLVDIVVPSCFFNTDFDADMTEWVELAADTPVRIYPGIEEAYWAGYATGVDVNFLDAGEKPTRSLLADEMISAVAANHWASGVDGLYVFNWPGKTWEGNRLNLDNLGDPRRLEFRDKLYPLTRRDGQPPYCDLARGPLPARLGAEAGPHLAMDERFVRLVSRGKPWVTTIRVADNLPGAANRVENCRLWVHLVNASVEDAIEVAVNGQVLTCANPLAPGTMHTPVWLGYELKPEQVRRGGNEIRIRLLSRDLPAMVQESAPIEIADVELEIRYSFPNGKGREPRGFRPRT